MELRTKFIEAAEKDSWSLISNLIAASKAGEIVDEEGYSAQTVLSDAKDISEAISALRYRANTMEPKQQ